MRLEEIINQHRQNLNDTDMVIYKYIVQHRAQARHISIHELAKNCAVSSTTIVRFAQKLGFDGFGDLKAVLKLEEGDKSVYKDDVLQDLQEFYSQTASKVFKRNFDSASRLVHEANRVFIFASGYVQSNVAQELKRLFFYDNVLIYATSNRRHLIRENFSDKEEVREDMHTSDTVQEKLSLVYRFGVSIYFGAPTKKEFQQIVVELAEKQGVKLPAEELLAEANKWELSHGGLSGRTAQQFINYMLGQEA